MYWCLIFGLISTSLTKYDMENFFHMLICNLYIYNLVRCLLKFLAHFFLCCFFSYCGVLRVFKNVLDNNSLSDIYHANIFSQCSLLAHSLKSIFCRTKFFNFNEVRLVKSFFHGSWMLYPKKSSRNSR